MSRHCFASDMGKKETVKLMGDTNHDGASIIECNINIKSTRAFYRAREIRGGLKKKERKEWKKRKKEEKKGRLV